MEQVHFFHQPEKRRSFGYTVTEGENGAFVTVAAAFRNPRDRADNRRVARSMIRTRLNSDVGIEANRRLGCKVTLPIDSVPTNAAEYRQVEQAIVGFFDSNKSLTPR